MEYKNIVIAGIGTDVGKTICSAVVCEALKANYWKPIQAGDLENSDSIKVSQLVTFDSFRTFDSAYNLQTPMSPHEAANLDGISMKIDELKIPTTSEKLIIEMAGGLMVPVNSNELYIDFVTTSKLPVILVCNYYLGSVNHSLLTLELLKLRNVNVLGIIFNGKKVQSTFAIILNHYPTKSILEIDFEENITPEIISHYANEFSKTFSI